MKIILGTPEYARYSEEALSAVEVVRSSPAGEEGLRSAIATFKGVLVKLSGYQQDVNSDSVEGRSHDVSTKQLYLHRVKGDLKTMCDDISARLSSMLDPSKRGELNPGFQTLRWIVEWCVASKAATHQNVGSLQTCDVSRNAMSYLTRFWGFEVKLNTFKCCTALGLRVPLAQVVMDLYSMELQEFLTQHQEPREPDQMVEAAETLMASLNVNSGDS